VERGHAAGAGAGEMQYSFEGAWRWVGPRHAHQLWPRRATRCDRAALPYIVRRAREIFLLEVEFS
jgi:hypothetical protein